MLAALGAATAAAVLVHPGTGPGLGAVGREPVVSDLDASPVSGEARQITCWDGTTTAAARECSLPEGRVGLATVFPTLDVGCVEATPVVGGKVEVFTCRGQGYVVRYTRWEPGFDRFAAFTAVNRGLGNVWTLGGDFAGRRWSSQGSTSDGVRHFRWTATYRAQPFSVEVQATTTAGRDAGIAAVETVPPRRLGRA